MSGFFLLTMALVLSMTVIPFARHLAPHLGMVDVPDPRKIHTVPVPRAGGWGIAIGSLVPIILVFKLDPMLKSLVGGGLVLFAFGLWDDCRQISHWVKFGGASWTSIDGGAATHGAAVWLGVRASKPRLVS